MRGARELLRPGWLLALLVLGLAGVLAHVTRYAPVGREGGVAILWDRWGHRLCFAARARFDCPKPPTKAEIAAAARAAFVADSAANVDDPFLVAARRLRRREDSATRAGGPPLKLDDLLGPDTTRNPFSSLIPKKPARSAPVSIDSILLDLQRSRARDGSSVPARPTRP